MLILNQIANLLREFCFKGIVGYNALSEKQKNLFDETYRSHIASLREEKRALYSENNLEKVDGNVSVVLVLYKNGDKYLYVDGERWVQVKD